jgi:hypothetical protein
MLAARVHGWSSILHIDHVVHQSVCWRLSFRVTCELHGLDGLLVECGGALPYVRHHLPECLPAILGVEIVLCEIRTRRGTTIALRQRKVANVSQMVRSVHEYSRAQLEAEMHPHKVRLMHASCHVKHTKRQFAQGILTFVSALSRRHTHTVNQRSAVNQSTSLEIRAREEINRSAKLAAGGCSDPRLCRRAAHAEANRRSPPSEEMTSAYSTPVTSFER